MRPSHMMASFPSLASPAVILTAAQPHLFGGRVPFMAGLRRAVGPLVVRSRIHGYGSPPLHLSPNTGEAVHPVLEPDGTAPDALPTMFDKDRFLRLPRHDQLWAGPGTGVQGANR